MWCKSEENVACGNVCVFCIKLIKDFFFLYAPCKIYVIWVSPTLHLKFFYCTSLDTFCFTWISVMGNLEQNTNCKVRPYWFRQWYNAFFFSLSNTFSYFVSSLECFWTLCKCSYFADHINTQMIFSKALLDNMEFPPFLCCPFNQRVRSVCSFSQPYLSLLFWLSNNITSLANSPCSLTFPDH